ncbi:MAG: hypothetical protein H0U64_07160 [Gemmatimonadaceae bacterium]|nr:hypothetical protein [Gemmatimonadaceae bacterium]
MEHREHNFVREGILAGAVGATAIAIWFLVIDVVAGKLLYTPKLLGHAVISVLGNAMPDSTFTQVLGYTVFHYAAFAIIGIILVAVVHQAERTPAILAGLLIVFVALQLGVYVLSALLKESPLGGMAWSQIYIANLLASAAMGWFIWKRHPKLGRNFTEALDGSDDLQGV